MDEARLVMAPTRFMRWVHQMPGVEPPLEPGLHGRPSLRGASTRTYVKIRCKWV